MWWCGGWDLEVQVVRMRETGWWSDCSCREMMLGVMEQWFDDQETLKTA